LVESKATKSETASAVLVSKKSIGSIVRILGNSSVPFSCISIDTISTTTP